MKTVPRVDEVSDKVGRYVGKWRRFKKNASTPPVPSLFQSSATKNVGQVNSSSESARLAPLVGAGQTPDFVEARLFDKVEQTAAGV